MTEQCTIEVMPGDKQLICDKGDFLLEVLQDNEIQLRAECGGEGTCCNCQVKASPEDSLEYEAGDRLEAEKRKNGYFLACQLKVTDDLQVEIPASSLISGQQILLGEGEEDYLEHRLDRDLDIKSEPLYRRQLLELPEPSLQDNTSDLERLRRELQQENGDEFYDISLGLLDQLAGLLRDNDWEVTVDFCDQLTHQKITGLSAPGPEDYYGMAVDIGTTTMVASLLDPQEGREMARAGEYNHQARYGDDVIARINYASKNEGGIEEVHRAVVETINELIDKVSDRADIDKNQIRYIITAGNTTMTHTLYGIDPNHIRHSPFTPTFSQAPTLRASEIDLDVHDRAPIYSFSAIGSFVGGDIISGVLSSGLSEQEEMSMLIDIGTNGEVVVGNSDFLIACSASAGPAFEGGGIESGVRAMDGAIEQIYIDDDYEPIVKTIGDKAPVGICGTGLIDLIASMQKDGILNRSGRYNTEIETDRLRQRSEDNREFLLVSQEKAGIDEDIVLTEHDINHVLRSKAAIYAAVKIILDKLSFTEDMIQNVYIAGGFGNYLNIDAAVRLGLFPDLPRDRFVFIGNSSLAGARQATLSASEFKRSREIAREMTYLELSSEENSADFMDEFVAAKFIPHTDVSLFPSLQE